MKQDVQDLINSARWKAVHARVAALKEELELSRRQTAELRKQNESYKNVVASVDNEFTQVV